MISPEFLDSLGMTQEAKTLLEDALRKEAFFLDVLLSVGVYPECAGKVAAITDTTRLDPSQRELISEKVRAEWAGFIAPKTSGNTR